MWEDLCAFFRSQLYQRSFRCFQVGLEDFNLYIDDIVYLRQNWVNECSDIILNATKKVFISWNSCVKVLGFFLIEITVSGFLFTTGFHFWFVIV